MTSGTARQRLLGTVAFTAYFTMSLTAQELSNTQRSRAKEKLELKPVQVFILAGQSNMEGQAVVDLKGNDYNDGKGTLTVLMQDPVKAPLLSHLKNSDGKWTVRDDVFVRYQREDLPLRAGPLAIGFSVYGDAHHFGPELQFGHVIGDHIDNPVLLIKTAWGGKSLYQDFRPPSSGGKVGNYYTLMVEQVRDAVANMEKEFSVTKSHGYELAGFIWYHGWNDGVNPQTAVPEYEQNLVNLINDVRKAWNAPKLPVVIGELTGPWVDADGGWNELRKAQAAAAAKPEFVGNVTFVPTHDFVRKPEESPNPGHGHHEFGNAETYFLVGDALGKGMIQLLEDAKTPLSIDSIFLEKQFAVEPFKGRWQSDSQGFELIKKAVDKEKTSIVRIGLDHLKTEEVLVPSDWLKPTPADKPLVIDAYEWSEDRTKLLIFTNTKRVWRLNTRGDYWVLDLPTKRLSKIGGDSPESSLMFAKFTPDGKNVAYVRDRDIYIQDLLDEKITRLTTADAPTKINGTFDWVYEEEFSLHDGFRFSPDGKRIAFWEIDGSEIELFPLVDNTSTLYPKIQFIPYPKVGTTNPGARIGTIDLESSAITWMQIPGDVRNNYLPRMKWIDEKQLAIQQLNRTQNHLQLYVADAMSGDAELIFTERDAGWIDVRDELIWLKDKTQFIWLSERTGWQHIYLVSRDGKTVKAVTSGDFDVIDVLGVDEPAELVYFYASPDTGTQKYLYRVKLDGSELARVTPKDQPGTHVYILSPDGKRALVTSSQFSVPPVTRVVQLSDHAVNLVVEPNNHLRSKLASVQLSEHEFFQVNIGEGVALDAWCILPPNFDANKKYPLLVYVYGEPAGQTVLDQWAAERGLWHHMLAQQGFVVMSFDNRGTPSPRGRAWRKSVYRQIGILAAADQAAALQSVLASRPYLDRSRVGVWGWSGGGSMTLNAMFRYPELYASGVSIAPVPNQLYYDTIYQERYMGLPADNADGYRLGSPITFAHQLQGDLLLIHGTGDDNCHYQTSELLINELIKHNKKFSMFAYPNRSHAIREGENTTRHLHQMITDHFHRTLAP